MWKWTTPCQHTKVRGAALILTTAHFEEQGIHHNLVLRCQMYMEGVGSLSANPAPGMVSVKPTCDSREVCDRSYIRGKGSGFIMPMSAYHTFNSHLCLLPQVHWCVDQTPQPGWHQTVSERASLFDGTCCGLLQPVRTREGHSQGSTVCAGPVEDTQHVSRAPARANGAVKTFQTVL